MNNSDMPINGECPNKEDSAWAAAPVGGLTKREHFAALAMQGFTVNAGVNGRDADLVASWSVEYAGALLKALEDE